MTHTRIVRSVAVLTSAMIGALLLAGCRVPGDSSPREIPAAEVPFGLLAPSTTTPPPTSPVATVDGTIYLAKQGRLVPVKRSITAPLLIGSVIASLVQGPINTEASEGLTTSVGPQNGVVGAQLVDGVAVVDISDAFSGFGVQEQVIGLAQIVYTATEVPGVRGVRIQLNAQPASVPRGDGSATTDVLTRADYVSLAPQ